MESEKISALRTLFPRSINVRIRRSRDGGFAAEVRSFSSCFTEAESFSELIEMVNDAARTYLEVPRKYVQFMPTYIPPLRAAQQFDAFPIRVSKAEIQLELLSGRGAGSARSYR